MADRYRIDAVLGRGGMGAVYEAEHLGTGERLAVKVLHSGGAARELARRFEREAKAMSLLAHPSIVEVLDFGALDDGGMFLVMELVRGVSLADLMEVGPVASRRVLGIVRQVLEALAHAHGIGVIHRDLKPENIMLVPDDSGDPAGYRVKLLDFGIAKVIGEAASEVGGETLTQAGITFGTPDYMSPEQALGQPVDGRADLYSAGVILFELLAGRKLYENPDPVSVVRMQVTAPVPTLREAAPHRPFPPAVEHLVARALTKPRAERFAAAGEMIAALDAAVTQLEATPRPESTPPILADLLHPPPSIPSAAATPSAPATVPNRFGPRDPFDDVDPRMIRIALLASLGLLFLVVLVALLATSG